MAVTAHPDRQSRRTPAGEERIEDWELGVPPAPEVALEERADFQAAVVPLRQDARGIGEEGPTGKSLPPAPPSEMKVHAGPMAAPHAAPGTMEAAKVAVAARVDPRRAVTARIVREAKPPLSPLPPAMPVSKPAPSGRGTGKRWGLLGVLLVPAAVGVLVVVSQVGPSGKVPGGAPSALPVVSGAGPMVMVSAATASAVEVVVPVPSADGSAAGSAVPSSAPAVRGAPPAPVREVPKDKAPEGDPYDAAPPSPPKMAAPPSPQPPPATVAPITPAPPMPSSAPTPAPAGEEIFNRPKPKPDDAPRP